MPRSRNPLRYRDPVARRILVLNGPNLNLLGTREPEVYGTETLDDIMADLAAFAAGRDAEITPAQSNSEGTLVDLLQDARTWAEGVVFNPGAYTHYSIALRDTVTAIQIPVVETHLSNVHARETFRHTSVLSAVCLGVVAGFGRHSYVVALDGLLRHLGRDDASARTDHRPGT
jgi:3-dehydroquinate dehydratase II